MSSQKKIVKTNGAAPDDLEDKVAAELINLEVRSGFVGAGPGLWRAERWPRMP